MSSDCIPYDQLPAWAVKVINNSPSPQVARDMQIKISQEILQYGEEGAKNRRLGTDIDDYDTLNKMIEQADKEREGLVKKPRTATEETAPVKEKIEEHLLEADGVKIRKPEPGTFPFNPPPAENPFTPYTKITQELATIKYSKEGGEPYLILNQKLAVGECSVFNYEITEQIIKGKGSAARKAALIDALYRKDISKLNALSSASMR